MQLKSITERIGLSPTVRILEKIHIVSFVYGEIKFLSIFGCFLPPAPGLIVASRQPVLLLLSLWPSAQSAVGKKIALLSSSLWEDLLGFVP